MKFLLHYCHRFHQSWSAYYYGSPGEREAHNGAIRETLKQQIDDRDTARVYDFHTRISESIEVGQRDRTDVESDSARVAEHKRRLLEYRDANKRVRFYRFVECFFNINCSIQFVITYSVLSSRNYKVILICKINYLFIAILKKVILLSSKEDSKHC